MDHYLDGEPQGLGSLPLFHFLSHPTRQVSPGKKPPLLLLLHGIGGSEYDLFGLAPYLDPRLLVLSLRAPVLLRPDSYAWFEVNFAGEGPIIHPEQAEASRLSLIDFIERAPAAYGADPSEVYLFGFSQGAIISLAVTLTRPDLLAGVVAASGRLLPELFKDDSPLSGHLACDEELSDFPLMVVHGCFDQVLTIEYGRAIQDHFTWLPAALTYREYDMAHTISDDALDDIGAWLSARLDGD